MVATRSQDHGNHASPTVPPAISFLENYSTPSSGKRKAPASKNRVSKATPNPVQKRRKLDAVTPRSELEISQTLAAVVIPVPNPVHRIDGAQGEGSKEGNLGTNRLDEGASRSSQGANGQVSSSEQEAVSGFGNAFLSPHTPSSKESTAAPKQSTSASTTKAAPSTTSGAKKSHKRDSRVEVTSMIANPSHAILHPSEENPTQSRHKHFQNEEPPPPQLSSNDLPLDSLNTSGQVEASEEETSGDEAPEVVTQSAGLETARSAAAEAAKAADAQRAVEKQRRRERDSLLKGQAKTTKKVTEQVDSEDSRPVSPMEDNQSYQPSPSTLDPPNAFKWSSNEPLPALLPDELLAIEPMVRLSTPIPEPVVAKPSVNTKRRFVEEISKPPKDVRKGNVRIRVLEERRTVLPPKISKSSKLIRESWLAGRSGAKGRMLMERRKMGGNFVRGKKD
ncbi:MAG: hypothetical protein Q9170_006463 [Blastenia crenularia]